MGENFIRIFAKKDVNAIKPHLMIYGDLSATCANCQAMDVKMEAVRCPQCGNDFKYIAFRNFKSHLPKMNRLFEERPYLTIVDFEDYQKSLGQSKAQEFFK